MVGGRVMARHGGSWTVHLFHENVSQDFLMQMVAKDPDIVSTLIRGRVDVQIDQRGAEWAEPGGPEENAFRTIVALTENN